MNKRALFDSLAAAHRDIPIPVGIPGLTFIQALNSGMRLRRKCWPKACALEPLEFGKFAMYLTIKDYNATDWETE